MVVYRILFFLCFALLENLIAALSDTLKQGEFINSSTVLVSSNNTFIMGFFAPDSWGYSYLGIWYMTDHSTSIRHPPWVANRNTPISDNSGVLIIDPKSGDLIIQQNDSNLLVLYSGGSVVSSFNRTLTLLNSGNLVLKEGNITLWQSFDHPTDTLLPGMKLGINHKTNRKWSLTSWLSGSHPANGAFTLEWDPTERMMVVRYRGKIHLTSGNDFENFPLGDDYKYKNVSDKDEDYFFYTPADLYSGSGLQLDYMGNINDIDNERQIAASDDCYGYKIIVGNKYNAGCKLWEQPKCRNERQKFEIQTGYFKYHNFPQIPDYNASAIYSDCKAMCWEDCDCSGFWNGGGGNGCIFYKRTNSKFHSDVNSGKIHILVSDYTDPSDTLKQKKWRKVITIVVIVPVVYVLLLILSGLLRDQQKKFQQAKERKIHELGMMNGYTDTINELGNDGLNDLKFFSYTDIMAATRNFSSDNKLGEGGFGPVYKGEFPEGQEIAVKRLSRKSTQGMIELKNEFILIAKLQHTNLVRLLGSCIHREEKMLIYEYMPNKSLDFFLFDESKREQLTWERRFSIIGGIAQGLLYLHTYSRLRIIHRDLKAANILLDQDMIPKISDFGMARIFKQNLSEANTNRVVGTYGYMAPEYAMEGIFSVKSDVYSFGVLILEILSGRKNNSFYHVDGPLNLVALAWELWNTDATFELMDPSISDSCIHHQFLRCVHLGLLCVEDRAVDRPTMVDFISMFLNDTADFPLPKRPAFYTGSRSGETEPRETKPEKFSLNDLSMSATEGR